MKDSVIQTEDMQVCFVNTMQPPCKIKPLGHFDYQEKDGKYTFQELCEVHYPHPDVPDMVTVHLLQWEDVSFPKGLHKSVAYAIDAMKGFKSVKS